MNPDIDAQAAKLILFNEGERLKPYKDSRGIETIGVGHNLANGISPAVSAQIFAEDRATALAELNRNLPWWTGLPANAQVALMDMSFNLGGRLLSFHQFLHALQFKQYRIAAGALMDSDAARQLPNRYGRLRALILSCV